MKVGPKQENLMESGPGILFREGMDTFVRGNSKEALQYFRKILRHSQSTGDQNNIGWSLLHMAMVLRNQQQYRHVLKALIDAKTTFTDIDNAFGLASVYYELSLTHRTMDRPVLALEFGDKSTKLFQKLGRTLELGWSYDNLSNIHAHLFQVEQAFHFGKMARSLFSEFHSLIGLAWNACHLGSLEYSFGSLSKAEGYYIEAGELFEKTQNMEGMAAGHLGLATVLRAHYRFEEAVVHLASAQQLYKKLGKKDRLAWCLLNEAAIRRTWGEEEKAMHLNRMALRLFSPLRCHDGVAWTLFQMGQTYRDQGYLSKSWNAFREALNLHTDVDNKKGMAWSENEWGKTYLELNDLPHAKECLLKARVISDPNRERGLETDANKNLARLYIEEGYLRKAESLLNRVQNEAVADLLKETETEAYLELARYAFLIGDTPAAGKAVTASAGIITDFKLRRLVSMKNIYEAEHLMLTGELEKAREKFVDVLKVDRKHQQRWVHAKALMGLIQLRLHEGQIALVPSLLSALNKDVRTLTSQKVKAKYLVLNALASYKKSGVIDDKTLNQALQIASTSNLMVLECQILDLILELHEETNTYRERKKYEARKRELMVKGPVDLYLVRTHSIHAPLPVSLTV